MSNAFSPATPRLDLDDLPECGDCEQLLDYYEQLGFIDLECGDGLDTEQLIDSCVDNSASLHWDLHPPPILLVRGGDTGAPVFAHSPARVQG